MLADREWSRLGAALLAIGTTVAGPAAAEPGPEAEPVPPLLRPASGSYLHMLGALSVGRGLRFNNPYRLATPLGDSPESLSLTATYADLAATAAFGDPNGLQHGGSVHLSVALDGVPQEVATPSYVLLGRLPPRTWLYGRFGLPIVLEPDANLGWEMAGGGVWLVSGGLGLTAELVTSVFYGAATQDKALTVIPIVSLQLGVAIDYEVLP